MSILDITPPAFVDQAACAGAEPELFFPIGAGDSMHEAKAICGRCDVRDKCLSWALEMEAAHPGTRHGVYGGLSPQERMQIARRSA